MTSADHEEHHPDTRLPSATARIVCAYLGGNHLPAGHIGILIDTVGVALAALTAPPVSVTEPIPVPAVRLSRSVFDDHIVCLEDGLPFKSLRRHLSAKYGLTPDQYRKRWGLPDDYPMIAPTYARERSELAKSIGLGRKRKALRHRKA